MDASSRIQVGLIWPANICLLLSAGLIGLHLAAIAGLTVFDLFKFVAVQFLLSAGGAAFLACVGDRNEKGISLLSGWAIAQIILALAQGMVGALALWLGIQAAVVYPTIYVLFAGLAGLGVTHLLRDRRLFAQSPQSLHVSALVGFLSTIILLTLLNSVPRVFCEGTLVLASDNTVYNEQAIRYLNEGFSAALAVKSFPHPVLAATISALTDIGVDKLVGFLMPITNVVVLAVGCKELIRALQTKRDDLTCYLGPVFIIFFANLDWGLRYFGGPWLWDGQLSRNIMTGQLWVNPYIEAMAIAIWGIIELARSDALVAKGSILKAALFLAPMAYFRPFIFYPFLLGLSGSISVYFLTWKHFDRKQLVLLLAVSSGLVFLVYQGYMRTKFDNAPISMPHLTVDAGALQEPALNIRRGRNLDGVPGSITVIVDDKAPKPRLFNLAEYIFAFVLQFFLGAGVELIAIILTCTVLFSQSTTVITLYVAMLASFSIPTIFRFVPNGANDILQFAITGYFFGGVIFWAIWWEKLFALPHFVRVFIVTLIVVHVAFVPVLIHRVASCSW